MSTDRLTRVNELILHSIASAMFRVVNEPGFEAARVTITRVTVSPDLRHARVMVSVIGDAAVKQNTLRAIRHSRRELQAHIAREVVIKYTPQLDFQLDESIAEGDRVLNLLAKLEAEQPAPAAGGPPVTTDDGGDDE